MSSFFLKPPASGAPTGGLFGSAPAQPAAGLFGSTGGQQQNQQASGLFGNTGGQQQNQPAGGLFGNAGGEQQTQPSGGLFGNTAGQQQTQQSGGLFGNTAGQQQTQQSGGLFGNTAGQQPPQQSTGLFGNTGGLFNKPPQQQPQQQTGGLFGNTGGLFSNTQQPQQQQQQQPGSLFNNPAGGLNPNKTTNILNLSQDPSLSCQRPSNKTQIDIDHLRPTTKYDHLTPSLQSEISAVETHILAEMHKCAELRDALPSITQSGKDVPESYAFVREKFDELALALENDAAEIVDLRDRVVRRDVAEGRLCWKSVDRLKMPSQYQSAHAHAQHHGGGGVEAVYGGSGLSGWWNNPTMSTRTRHGGQRNVVSVEDDAEVEVAGGTLVDLLHGRVEEMGEMLRERKELLGEIEGFVGNLEGKILMREREVVEGVGLGGEGEKDRQIKMLRYVFGEVERSLYEVADRVGESRDRLMELGERTVRAKMAF